MALIHFRILAYILTIVLHTGNSVYVNLCFTEDTLKYQVVRNINDIQFFFLTSWTFAFQTLHAAIALYTDILTLRNFKSGKSDLSKWLTGFRNEFFSVAVWPSTIFVFSVFWTFYVYDRNLLYPEDFDIAVTSTSNNIMHTWIMFASVWEIISRSRFTPRVHKWRVLVTLVIALVYIMTAIAVHQTTGIWTYPILGLLNGTIFFYPFFVAAVGILVVIYYAQWPLKDLVWGSRNLEKIK